MMNKKSSTGLLLLFAVLVLGFWLGFQQKKTPTSVKPTPSVSSPGTKEDFTSSNIPDYVFTVYRHVLETGKAPEGYVGGRVFQNRERRLPKRDASNQSISYQEWDVLPKKKGVNRGPERLVTGNNTAAYYTPDHYETFYSLLP
jgi:ribonuclease T1